MDGFFDGITWGQIVITALVAVLTTLAVEYFAKPSLEIRKIRKIRDGTQVDELLFKLQEIQDSLTSIVEFKSEKIIPTHQHMLSQQLKHVHLAAEQVQQRLAQLKRTDRRNMIEEIRKIHNHVSALEAAAIKTKANVDEGKFSDFKIVNQPRLARYIAKIEDSIVFLGKK